MVSVVKDKTGLRVRDLIILCCFVHMLAICRFINKFCAHAVMKRALRIFYNISINIICVSCLLLYV